MSPALAVGDKPSYHDGKMKLRTRITTKGQIVIPKALRERLRWRKGTRLEIRESEEGLVLRQELSAEGQIDQLLASLHGCLGDGDPIGELEREHREEIVADAQRAHRR